MRLTALRCGNKRCGLVLFAGLGFAIQACPCCHRPMETIGVAEIPMHDFHGNEFSDMTATAVEGPRSGGSA